MRSGDWKLERTGFSCQGQLSRFLRDRTSFHGAQALHHDPLRLLGPSEMPRGDGYSTIRRPSPRGVKGCTMSLHAFRFVHAPLSSQCLAAAPSLRFSLQGHEGVEVFGQLLAADPSRCPVALAAQLQLPVPSPAARASALVPGPLACSAAAASSRSFFRFPSFFFLQPSLRQWPRYCPQVPHDALP